VSKAEHALRLVSEASKQLLCMLASAQLLLSFAEQEQEQAEHAQAPLASKSYARPGGARTLGLTGSYSASLSKTFGRLLAPFGLTKPSVLFRRLLCLLASAQLLLSFAEQEQEQAEHA
jgi:hypothetical protein